MLIHSDFRVCYSNMVYLILPKMTGTNNVEQRKHGLQKKRNYWGFPGGSVVKNLPPNSWHMSLIPGLGVWHIAQSN